MPRRRRPRAYRNYETSFLALTREEIQGRHREMVEAGLFGTQQTEVGIGCTVLNRMLACARPNSLRRIGTTS
jgi:hypothetical protein